MTDNLKSHQQLTNEIKDLRTRLEVAEETIQAIHHGRVDALIVAQFEKARAILLEGAEIPYHAIVDSMGEGVVTLIPDGTIFFCNPRFVEIVQIPLEKLIGTSFIELVPSEDKDRLAEIFKDSGLGISRGEFSIQTPQGKLVSVQLSAQHLETEDEEDITIVITDLSDRKLAEQAQWEAEHKLNKTLQSMADGTLVVDLSGKITFVNPAAERILEIPNEKLIGISYYASELNLVDANRNPYPLDQLSLTIALRDQCEVKAVEHGILTASGKIKWLSVNTSPLLDEKGQMFGAIASFRDVSEEKKNEEELHQLHQWNALQASLLDQVRNAVIATDLDGKIFYWNKFAETLYQWKAEEVIGKPIQEVTVPQAEAGLSERIMNSIQQLGYWEGEFIVNRKDRSLFPAQVLDTLIKNTEGMVIGILGVSVDITERKRAEESIRTSEKRYRSLFENLNEGFAYCKMLYKNNQPLDFTYLDVNSSFEKITGLKNVVGKNVSEVIPGIQSTNPNLFEVFGKVALTGNPERFDSYIDQLRIWLSISVYSPESGYFIAVFDNITERKQAEEEIQSHTQELRMLYELSRALAGAKNLNQVLEIVNRHTVKNVNVTFSRIGLLEGDNLVMRGAYPIRVLDHDLFIEDRKPITTLPNCRRVLKGNKPVVVHESNLKVGNEERSALLLDHMQSICLMPLRVGKTGTNSGHLLGMLMVGEARDKNREPISPRKLSLIGAIGDQAASAIRRMLLSQETERRLQQLSALSEIDRLITSSVDLNTSLMTVLTQIIKQLDVDAASVMLLNSSNLTLEFFCGQGFQNKAIERSRLRLGESHAGKAALERVIVHIPNLQDSNHVLVTPNLIEENFVEYYGVPLIAKGQVKGILEIFNRTPLRLEDEMFGFLKALAEQAAIAIDSTMMFNNLTRSNIELKLAYTDTIEGWSRALDLRDKETEGHTLRVTEQSLELARSFGLGEDELINIQWGGLLHDIGKMGIPDGILLKPGPLTEEEWVLMRKHPTMAYELLSPIHYLQHALDIPYCHHEKWDGTGYPRGLKGEQIPLKARIFAVVDVWDALRSDRPYRPAWPIEKTIEYIQSESGTHFDPKVVEAFLINMGVNGKT